MFLRNKCVVFALVLGVLFMCGPAQAGTMRPDVPSSSYEAFAADPMFQSAGEVSVHLPSGWLHGSGVLIAPSWVLTAGHNILGTDDLGGGISEMRWYMGANIYTNFTDKRFADAWYIYPGYSSSYSAGHGVDMGLIHLSQPVVDVSPVLLYSSTIQRGDLMYMADYGAPGWADSGVVGTYDGIKRAGSAVMDHFGDDPPLVLADSEYLIANYVHPDNPNYQPLQWGSTPGASGCPWYEIDNGTPYLAGIDSAHFGFYGYGGASGSVQVSPYVDWIDQTTNVPEPSTIVIFITGALIVGPVALLRRRRKQNG